MYFSLFTDEFYVQNSIRLELMQPVPNAMDGSVRYAVIIGETKTYIYKDKMGWYVYPKEKITAKDIERGRRKVVQSFI